MTSDQTKNREEEREVSGNFADVELVERMKKLGFDLNHHEGIADWFKKDEGTSELTVFGAREMLEKIDSLVAEEVLKVLTRLEKELPFNDKWHAESDEEVGMLSVRETMKDAIEAELATLKEVKK